jgi:hypothetical protein
MATFRSLSSVSKHGEHAVQPAGHGPFMRCHLLKLVGPPEYWMHKSFTFLQQLEHPASRGFLHPPSAATTKAKKYNSLMG